MLNLNTLNPQQREAVTTINGPVLILAGAGTGKTRVITCRIAHMVGSGVAPGHILAVTFTNKAAREMRERVTALLPPKRGMSGDAPKEERPTICTFHSLCARILRQHIEKLGYKRNFVIYDTTEQISAIKKLLPGFVSKGLNADPGAVLAVLSRIKNGGENAALFAEPMYRELASLMRASYESALRACNAVDFDDLILLTLRIFDEFPEALDACRAKYRYVMVDEYQDTNAAQFRLVHALTSEGRNLCVVGDDDQSIYGWRGADTSNLLDMEKHYPEVKVIKLEQNYRSTNTILNAANAVIKRNPARRGKKLWSQNGDGAKIELHEFPGEEDEAQAAVDRIQLARLRQTPWRDHAILFRTNAQSRPIEMALRRARVRYHLIGGQSFFDRKEVRDVLAYLKVMVNPHEDISLLRIANVPSRGLSDVTMERLVAASAERKCSVFTAMKNPAVTAMFQKRASDCIEEFSRFIEHRRAQLESGAAGDSLRTWASGLLDSIGYFTELLRSEKNVETGENRVQNLKDLIATFDVRSTGASLSARLENFLEEVTLDAEREAEEEEAGDAVTLITMHSCKGLEFPHVHIVGMEQGLLPHTRSAEENTVDEERRLFYVALTRARQTLALSCCRARTKYGEKVRQYPSAFLKELPEELVERVDPASAKPVSADTGRSLFAALRARLE
jgi:superfamily I DNA/RNA helicase